MLAAAHSRRLASGVSTARSAIASAIFRAQPANDTSENGCSYGGRASESLIWTSKDLIRFAGGDTNLYAYVLNEPTVLLDVLGLSGGSGGSGMPGGGLFSSPPLAPGDGGQCFLDCDAANRSACGLEADRDYANCRLAFIEALCRAEKERVYHNCMVRKFLAHSCG